MAQQFFTVCDLLGIRREGKVYLEPFLREHRELIGDRDGQVAYLSQAATDSLRALIERDVVGKDTTAITKKAKKDVWPSGVYAYSYARSMYGGGLTLQPGAALYGVEAVGYCAAAVVTYVEQNSQVLYEQRAAWSEFHHLLNRCELPLTREYEGRLPFVPTGDLHEVFSRQATAGMAQSLRSWYIVRVGHMLVSLLNSTNRDPGLGSGKKPTNKPAAFQKMLQLPTPGCPLPQTTQLLYAVNCDKYIHINVRGKDCFFTSSEARSLALTLMAHGELMIELATGGRSLYGVDAYQTILEGRLLVYGMMEQYGNVSMDAVKMLESFCSVVLVRRHGKVHDQEFIENMGVALAQIHGQKTSEQGFATPLYRYLESLSDELLGEFCYANNTYGSCRGLESEGYDKQKKRMQMESEIVPVEGMKSVGGMLCDIVKAYYRKHSRLPPMRLPQQTEYDLLRSYVEGGRVSGLQQAVHTAFGLSSEEWYYVSIVDAFSFTHADHMAASMEDKSISPPRKDMDAVEKSGDPGEYGSISPEKKKCVLNWMKRLGFSADYEAFVDRIEAGDFNVLLTEAAKQTAKEKEIKRLIRFFISYTPRLRHLLWVIRENFVTVAPYVPGQLSHLQESVKEETITQFSDVSEGSEDDAIFFVNIDFTAWNLYQTHLKTYPLLLKIDEMFGSSLFRTLHIIPSFIKFFFPGTDHVYSTEGANGLGEGQLQFIWTVNTLGDCNHALRSLGHHSISTGSGDNVLGKVRIPREVIDTQYGGDLSLAGNRLKESMCDMFKKLGRETKSYESLVSDVISILLKHLDVAGTRMPMTLKMAAKRTSYATMGAPTLSASLGSLCGSLFAISEKGNTAILSRNAMLYNYIHTLVDLSTGKAREKVLSMPIPQLVALMLAGNEMGGITYIPLRDILVPGHSDLYCSRIGIMQLAAERSTVVGRYLDALIASPCPKDLDILDLARAPYSIPRLGAKGPNALLKRYIESSAITYATGDEARAYLKGATQAAKDKLSIILRSIRPVEPRMLGNVFDGSIVALAEKQLSKVMTESTMLRAGSRKALKDTIRQMMVATEQELTEAMERSQGIYNTTGVSLPPSTLSIWRKVYPHKLAAELRSITWGLGADTVTMPNPLDLGVCRPVAGPIVASRLDDVIIVGVTGEYQYLSAGMNRIYPCTKRGAYTRSKTSGKVSKGFTQHPITSPALKALKGLLTAFSYTNRRNDSAALAIIAVAASYVTPGEFMALASRVERTQGLIHHRMAATGYKPEQHTNCHPGLVSYYTGSTDTLSTLRETGNNYTINISHTLFLAKACRLQFDVYWSIKTTFPMPEEYTMGFYLKMGAYDPISSTPFEPPPGITTLMPPGGHTFFYSHELDQDRRHSIIYALMEEQAARNELEEQEYNANAIPQEHVPVQAREDLSHVGMEATYNFMRAATLMPNRTYVLPVEGAAGAEWVREVFANRTGEELAVKYDINLSDLNAVSVADLPILLAHEVASLIVVPFPEGELTLSVVRTYMEGNDRVKDLIHALSTAVTSSLRGSTMLAAFQLVTRLPWSPNALIDTRICTRYVSSAILSIVMESIQHYGSIGRGIMPYPRTKRVRSVLVTVGGNIIGKLRTLSRDIARSYMTENRATVTVASHIVRIVEQMFDGDIEPDVSPVNLLLYRCLKMSLNIEETQAVFVDGEATVDKAFALIVNDITVSRRAMAKGNNAYLWLLRFFEVVADQMVVYRPDVFEGIETKEGAEMDDRRLLCYVGYYLGRRTDNFIADLLGVVDWHVTQSTINLVDIDIERHRTLLKSSRTIGEEDREAMSLLSRSEQLAYMVDQGIVDPALMARRARDDLSKVRIEEEEDMVPQVDLKITDIFLNRNRAAMDECLQESSGQLSVKMSMVESQVMNEHMLISDSASLPDSDRRQIEEREDFSRTGQLRGPLKPIKAVSPAQYAKGGYGMSSTGVKLEAMLDALGYHEKENHGRPRHKMLALADGIGGFAYVLARVFPSAMVYTAALGDNVEHMSYDTGPLAVESEQLARKRILRFGNGRSRMDLRTTAGLETVRAICVADRRPLTLLTCDAELDMSKGMVAYDSDLARILLASLCVHLEYGMDSALLLVKCPLDCGVSTLSVLYLMSLAYHNFRCIRPIGSNLGNMECYMVAWGKSERSDTILRSLGGIHKGLEEREKIADGKPLLFVRQTESLYRHVMLPLRQLQTQILMHYNTQVADDVAYTEQVGAHIQADMFGNAVLGYSIDNPLSQITLLLPMLQAPEPSPIMDINREEYIRRIMDTQTAMAERLKRDRRHLDRAALRHAGIELNKHNLNNERLVKEAIAAYMKWLSSERVKKSHEDVRSFCLKAGHLVPRDYCYALYEYLSIRLIAIGLEVYERMLLNVMGDMPGGSAQDTVVQAIGHAVLDCNMLAGRRVFTLPYYDSESALAVQAPSALWLVAEMGRFKYDFRYRWTRSLSLGIRAGSFFQVRRRAADAMEALARPEGQPEYAGRKVFYLNEVVRQEEDTGWRDRRNLERIQDARGGRVLEDDEEYWGEDDAGPTMGLGIGEHITERLAYTRELLRRGQA